MPRLLSVLALLAALFTACGDAPPAASEPPFLTDADVALRIRYLPHGADFFHEYALAADGRFRFEAHEPGPKRAHITGRVSQPVDELFAQLDTRGFFELDEPAYAEALHRAAQTSGPGPHVESMQCDFDVLGHSGELFLAGPLHWGRAHPEEPALALAADGIELITDYVRANCRLHGAGD